MIEGKVIADVAWHSIRRAVSVALVIAIVAGVPWFAYEKGKTKGYSLCAKDRATYTADNQTIINADPKDVPMTIVRIAKIGFVWFRK